MGRQGEDRCNISERPIFHHEIHDSKKEEKEKEK